MNRPDVFLFRRFGAALYPIREAALVGGETVNYQTDPTGAVFYLEIEPTEAPTSAENMSPFSCAVSPVALCARHRNTL